MNTMDGCRLSECDPQPGRHGTVTPEQVEAARREAEWWHARANLTGDEADYRIYLRAAARLQDKRQYCTEFTQEGGMA